MAIAQNPIVLKEPTDSNIQKVVPDKSNRTKPENTNTRKWVVGSVSLGSAVGALITLNETWYKNYPRSSFHTFNDNGEWLQVDKFGHSWSAYNLSHAASSWWKWANVPDKDAVLIGTLSSLGYMTTIEFLDGHSAEWGWSWGDMAANIFGTSLYAGQQFKWNEQRIQYKFSSHTRKYEPSLAPRANDLFGRSLPEKLLKDYNTQTYWFSININSFLHDPRIPDWLSIAVGYGADGMFGGFENKANDKNGNIIFDRTDIKRYRQWYIAPDVNLSKIRTTSKFMKTVLSTLNILKFPLPALEFSNKKFKGHWLQF